MVVRFTAGSADDSDAGQRELAPVISFSASRKTKRGEEHGRARGNHPAGSALDPIVDDHSGDAHAGVTGARSTGAGNTGAGNTSVDNIGVGNTGVDNIDVDAIARLSPTNVLRPAHLRDRADGALSVTSTTWAASESPHAPGTRSSAEGSGIAGAQADGAGPVDAVGESERRAPVASLARKRGGAEVSAIDDDMVDELPPSIEDVENAVLKKLRRRGLSEAEILAECLALDLTAHQANELLERLRELGYVDDRALAEQLRYSHYERKSQSRQVVARLMSTRKIPAEVIDEVLEDIGSDDELSAAREVAEKRASQMTSLDDATMERRLVGFLARRGYPGGVVRTVVGEIIRGRRSSVRFR